MENKTYVPIPGKTDTEAANKRREDYALSRDLQATEYNEAITKRLKEKAGNEVKCIKCGKEFSPGTEEKNTQVCPECR